MRKEIKVWYDREVDYREVLFPSLSKCDFQKLGNLSILIIR